MNNVEHRIEGGKLIITVDVSPAALAAAPPSSTGKSNLVATTGGPCTFTVGKTAGLSFALNVMSKR